MHVIIIKTSTVILQSLQLFLQCNFAVLRIIPLMKMSVKIYRNTSFLTLKTIRPNLKSKFIQKSASIFEVFCLIFVFKRPFAHPMILFLLISYIWLKTAVFIASSLYGN